MPGLLVLLLGAAGVLAGPLEHLVKAVQEQVAHYRQHLPDLDMTRWPLDELLTAAGDESVTGASLETLRTRFLKVAMELNLAAKIQVLTRIRAAAAELESSPTDRGSYGPRRQLVLSYDYIERVAGRRPLYPRELGRPFVTLVETPADKDLVACDGFLRHLAKLDPPKPPPGGFGHVGVGGGGPEDGGEPASAGTVGVGPGDGQSDPVGAPVLVGDDIPVGNRGWELVRWYILAVLGALVLLYFAYLAYTAARGGKNVLGYMVDWVRRRGRAAEDPEDPFRKGMRLFGRGKYQEALALFEPLTEQARHSSSSARYYLVLSALKLEKTGLAARHAAEVARDKFSADELYRLAQALEEGGLKQEARSLFEFLAAKDSSFRDAGKRAERLRGG